MKVILTADVKKVGRKGEVKEVADGYAQNVLLPRNLAVPGTAQNLKKYKKQVERKEDAKAFSAALLKKTLKEVNGKTITIQARANEQGKLFEAIHEKHIIDALKKEFGVELPESSLELNGPIKQVGEISISLGSGKIKAKISLIIA